MGQDFRARYFEQLTFLETSSSAYDSGNEAEAVRLAVAIRNLVHDTRHSTSLLTYLGMKDRLAYRDTALPEPSAEAPRVDAGLCMLRMHLSEPGKITFIPPLDKLSEDRQHAPVCFKDWWELPVLRDVVGHAFTRANLVLDVANKDGGAHIDANLGAAYESLTRDNSSGFGQALSDSPSSASLAVAFEGTSRTAVAERDGVSRPANSIALASVRQIAHELMTSMGAAIADVDGELVLRERICPLPAAEIPTGRRNELCPCGSGLKIKRCFAKKGRIRTTRVTSQ